MKSAPLARRWILLASAALLSACEGFFGTKTDTEFLDPPLGDSRPVAYVPILPAWEGLGYPSDIIAGWDELIYVADSGQQKIIAYDESGRQLGSLPVPGLTDIAQDRRLFLLAAGRKDTTINGRAYNLPALYRISLNPGGAYGLANASIVKTLVHPFYFRTGSPTSNDEAVRFTSIAVLASNRYYVTRTGLANSTTQFGGPDDAVLLFDDEDQYVSPVAITTNLGLFSDYVRRPSGIATFAQPPQSPAVNSRGDFYFLSAEPSILIKAQRIRFNQSDFGSSYDVENLPVGDTSRADGFLYSPGRFGEPADVCVAGDGSNYVFIVDAAKDSLYQFNAQGFEGVNPPSGSRSRKQVRASFGGRGSSPLQFSRPMGVSYLNRIVYVADGGNGRILRFKLTTDFE
jgi:hypothetical protein